MGNIAPTFENLKKLKDPLKEIEKAYWLEHVFFSFQWWLLVIVFILVWVIWWHVVDKKRLTEILLVGFFIALISSSLDEIGYHYLAWDYKYFLHWSIDSFWACNLSVLPVLNMLIYQYFNTWKSYFFATLIKSFICAFLGENFLQSLNIYIPLTWKHTYSFVIFFIIGLFVRWIVLKIVSIQRNANATTN